MWETLSGEHMSNSAGEPAKPFSDTTSSSDLRRREEMLREYYCVQDFIDRYGERRLTVKSWSVTSCGVALGFGLMERSPVLFCLAAFGSLVFWYLEALWRTRQSVLIQRAFELEHLLAEGSNKYAGPEISGAFDRVHSLMDTASLMKMLLYPSVRVPHYFIFCVGILLFLGSLLLTKFQGVFAP
jgi:hypothetical protein